MSSTREWIYKLYIRGGILNPTFLDGLETFIQLALSQPDFMDGDKIKCPCAKCDNVPYRDQWIVRHHLCKYGFVKDYFLWRFHGETLEVSSSNPLLLERLSETSTYHRMIMDVAAPDYNINNPEEPPNPEAQKLYDMLKAADTELWPGCQGHTQLSLVARLMNLKSENHMSEKCFDQICELMPSGRVMTTKKSQKLQREID